jgi:hypothetical protein
MENVLFKRGHVEGVFAPEQAAAILDLCLDHARFGATPVPAFMRLLA